MSIPRQLFILAIWPFLQQLLNWLTSAVDTSIAGHLSAEATSALAVAGILNWLMGLMIMSAAAGASALIARAIGGGHRSLAHAALGQGMILGMLICIGMALLVGAMADVLGFMVGLSGEPLALSSQYLRICAFALPIPTLLFLGASAMTAAGDARTPFIAMVVMNIINLAASIGLATSIDFGFFQCMGMGVFGIALGTVIGWTSGALVVLWALTRPNAVVRLFLHRLRPHAHTLERVWRIAWPSMAERGGHWGGQWAVFMIVGYLATRAGADSHLQGAHSIAIRIEALAFLPALAVATAAATLCGQYLGANRPEDAKRAATLSWIIGAGFMTLLGIVFIFVPEWLVRTMTDKPEFTETTPVLVQLAGAVQFFLGSAIILQGAMRGAGDTRVPALLFNILAWAVRLPLVAVMAFEPPYGFGLGLTGVWIALAIEMILRGLVFIYRFHSGAWQKIKV